jgi:hypothetical protein
MPVHPTIPPGRSAVRSRQPYTECRIYIDGLFGLEVGHYIRTAGGSGYFVTEVRQNRKRVHRRHLRCLRWPVAEIPADAVVHELRWYARKRKTTK